MSCCQLHHYPTSQHAIRQAISHDGLLSIYEGRVSDRGRFSCHDFRTMATDNTDYNLSQPITSTSGLRQGLAGYGDPHFSLFLRKVFIKALGYGEDALSRPIIGIINTYSGFNPCTSTHALTGCRSSTELSHRPWQHSAAY